MNLLKALLTKILKGYFFYPIDPVNLSSEQRLLYIQARSLLLSDLGYNRLDE